MNRSFLKVFLLFLILLGAMTSLLLSQVEGDAQETNPTTSAEQDTIILNRARERLSQLFNRDGLSGSFLTALHAAKINDFQKSYSAFYISQSLSPGNLTLSEQLMIYATIVKDYDVAYRQSEVITQLINGHANARFLRLTEAIKAQDFETADQEISALTNDRQSDLLLSILKAWVNLSLGKVAEALTIARSFPAEGAAEVIQNYHTALIADIGNWSKVARSHYALAYNAPEAGQRVGEAYINFLLRQGDKAQAETVRQDFETRFNEALLPSLDKAFVADKDDLSRTVPNSAAGVSEAFFDIGDVYFREGNYKFTAFYNRLAERLTPDMDNIKIRNGDLALARTKDNILDATDEALSVFRSISEDSPYYDYARSQIAIALLHQKKKDEAEAIFTSLANEAPDNIEKWIQLSNFLASEERFLEAAEVLQSRIDRLKSFTKDHFSLFYRAGTSYERAKVWDKAEPLLETALALQPDEPLVLNYLGYSWVDRGYNLSKALKMIEKAVSLRPQDGFIIDSLGWAYYRLKRFNMAVDYLEAAVERTPQDPFIQDHLGDAYWRVGRHLEARFQWDHALSLNPDDDLRQIIEKKMQTGLILSEADELPAAIITPGIRPEAFPDL